MGNLVRKGFSFSFSLLEWSVMQSSEAGKIN